MPLFLQLKPGEDFFIDHIQCVLLCTGGLRGCVLAVKDCTLHEDYSLVEGYATEVVPEVLISLHSSKDSGTARLAIEAPSTIKIWRGEIYRERNGSKLY